LGEAGARFERALAFGGSEAGSATSLLGWRTQPPPDEPYPPLNSFCLRERRSIW